MLRVLCALAVVSGVAAGNPPSEWDISGSGDPSIQGFTTDISVNIGQTISFKIKTSASAYHLDIYRMGYYGGDGAIKNCDGASVSYASAESAELSDEFDDGPH